MEQTLLAALLVKAKTILRISASNTAFDTEISDIIQAGYYDLTTRGVIIDQTDLSPLVLMALMTYVRWHFGEPEYPERLKASYDEQKGQLMMTSGFTDWGDA